MEEKECNVITLNNIEYTEIGRIKENNQMYIILSNLENPEDFCIKKLMQENNEQYIDNIESKEEFDRIMNIFMKKYLN